MMQFQRSAKTLVQNQSFLLQRLFSSQVSIRQTSTKFDYEWAAAKPFSEIPTLSKFQFMRAFLPGGKFYKLSLLDIHTKMKNDYGNLFSIPGIFGRDRVLMSFDPVDMEKTFRTEGIWPNRRSLHTLEYYRRNVRPEIFGEVGGIFNGQEEGWHKMRTTVNPIMMQPKAMKLYIPKVEAIADEFLSIVADKRDANNEVPANFGELVNIWSLETLTCIFLDKRLRVLDEKNQDKNALKLIQNMKTFLELSVEFEARPTIWRYYKTPKFYRLMEAYDGVTEVLLNYIDEAVVNLEKNPTEDKDRQSILEKLLNIDKKIAVLMASDALLAGVDTTASATVGLMYCLAKNPEKQAILREELIKLLPEKDSRLTPENMKNMPYLRACIKEAIRLYPSISVNMRKSAQNIVLQGYQVPKGIDVVMGSMVVSRMEEHYSKAKQFIPERWLKNADRTECPHAKTANPFTYLPFGFGARMCVGKRLADLEIEVLISRLIRQYKIEWHHPDMKIKSVLVNIPEGDLKFKIIQL